jgi:hypothetical protein
MRILVSDGAGDDILLKTFNSLSLYSFLSIIIWHK